jgi:Zn-dependent protease with chaperone function
MVPAARASHVLREAGRFLRGLARRGRTQPQRPEQNCRHDDDFGRTSFAIAAICRAGHRAWALPGGAVQFRSFMFEDLPGGLVVALLLALTPAFLRWWWGRALVPLADDPALPERLAALNRRTGLVTWFCGGLVIIGWPSSTFATLALLVVAQLAARFPLRRVLYQETWTLGAYLAFFLRLMLGAYGLVIAAVSMPWLASRAGRLDWAVAAALAIALGLWQWYGDLVLRRLVSAQPITDPTLLARFTALVSASGVPAPRFEYVPMHGGMMVNAVAAPSLRRSSVLFTETLLQRFSADETVAICAHEIAHLEYYNPVRLRRRALTVYTLVGLTAAVAPLSRIAFGAGDSIAFWIWPFVLFAGLIMRARRRQQNETASDLRAVALTGDAETLIRALTKLHLIARVPRRWDQAREQQATHPSLARRIRDIRASAGTAPAPLAAPATFPAAEGSSSVTFEAGHVDWVGDSGAKQALEYASLVELRLQASTGSALALVAVDRAGRRWQMTPRPVDVTALQSVLDTVDGRLTHQVKPAARAFSPILTRVAAYVIVSLASLAGQFAFAMVALLSVFIPSPRLLNAAGAAGVASTLLMLLRPGDGLFPLPFAALCAALAVVCFGLAWAKRKEQPRGTSVLIGILALAAIAAVALAATGGVDPIRLHQGVQSDPSAVVLLAALAGAASGWRRRAERYAALAALTAAAALFAVGTTTFLHAVGRDPFLITADPVTRTALTGSPAWEFDAESQIATLRLSPHGALAAVVKEIYEDDAMADIPPRVFQVAQPGLPLARYDADDLVFVDDQRALMVARVGNAAELREIDVASKAIVWRQDLPLVRLPLLSWQAQAERWTILGRTEDGGFVRLTGTLGGHDTQRAAWPALKDGGRVWFSAQASRGAALLGVETQFEGGLLQPVMAMARTPMVYRTSMFGWFQSHSQIWQLHDASGRVTARTVLDTTCATGAFEDGRLVCAAFDGTDSRLVTIDPESASIAPVAALSGRLRLDTPAGNGWVAGWSTATPVVLKLATRQMIEPPDASTHTIYKVAAADAAIGTVAWNRAASRVRVYPQKHE